MTLLGASIIILTSVIIVTHSQDLSFPETLGFVEGTDLGYRPWEQNDTSTTWISLDGMGITAVNSLFRVNIPDLKWLVMDNNLIQMIPSEAFKFWPDLTYVSLAGNHITKLGNGAFNFLDKLQVLDLDRNPMVGTNLDTGIFNALTALERLYLRDSGLSYFDLPESMNSLSHLYLSGNNLQTFHTDSESALTQLHLNNNHLSFISLSNFQSLIYLGARGNWLDKIKLHAQVSPVYYSKTLSNFWGYTATEHSALYLEYSPSLQYLIVSDNRLTRIESDSFLETEALIYVDLSGNQISDIRAGTFNNLLELECVLFDSNKITQINYRAFLNLPNLKILSLKNNLINQIDEDAFTKLNSSANEVYLFLDNNEIHTLKRGSFKDIKGLKYIGLSNNKIKTILTQAFVNLPSLESVVIENQLRDQTSEQSLMNPEMEVPQLVQGLIDSHAFLNLPNLTSIIIRGNLFSDIEAEAFHRLPKLRILDLSNNSIEYLSSEAFSDLPKVKSLYLRRNFLSEILPGTFPKQLEHLDLAENNVCPNFNCWNVAVGELHQLEELVISGIVERFKVEDLALLPENLTIVV